MPRRSAARAASKPTTKLILKRKKLVPRILASRRKLFTKRARSATRISAIPASFGRRAGSRINPQRLHQA
jgi:hypothetical protein